MQRSLVLCLFFALLALPASLSAQTVKQVEVVNEPLAVEVTNAPLSVEVTNFPQPTTPPRFQLVGFTNATFAGDTGVLGFTLACQSEFSGSRMCNSIEVLETTTVPSDLSGRAWVRPVYQPAAGSSNGMILDVSGSSIASESFGNLACNGWSSAEGFSFGMTVDGDGKFRAHTGDGTLCGLQNSIACCALVP